MKKHIIVKRIYLQFVVVDNFLELSGLQHTPLTDKQFDQRVLHSYKNEKQDYKIYELMIALYIIKS